MAIAGDGENAGKVPGPASRRGHCLVCDVPQDPDPYKWGHDRRLSFEPGYRFCQNPYHYPDAVPPSSFEADRQGGEE